MTRYCEFEKEVKGGKTKRKTGGAVCARVREGEFDPVLCPDSTDEPESLRSEKGVEED
jgi:hypothetical protein